MNAKDIAYGYAIGFNDGISMGGGGGEIDTPDPDYQKWLDLPEPNDNQAVFLIRVTNTTTIFSLTVNNFNSIQPLDDSFSVDWGDGSDIEIFASASQQINHTYSNVGEYVVTFTNILGFNDYVKPIPVNNFIMGKYGDNMCVHFSRTSAQSGSSNQNFKSYANLRYLKLPPTTEFNDYFFQNCYSLKKIEFNGTITTLYTGMFYACYNLDISGINFDNVTDIPLGCFYYCYMLKNVSFPSCLSIRKSAFNVCLNLESAFFPNCTNVEDSAFNCNYQLKSFTAANDCTYGTDCFFRCYKLSPRPDGTEY